MYNPFSAAEGVVSDDRFYCTYIFSYRTIQHGIKIPFVFWNLRFIFPVYDAGLALAKAQAEDQADDAPSGSSHNVCPAVPKVMRTESYQVWN